MGKFYNGPKVGIITKDPLRVKDILDDKCIDYSVIYGDDSKPDCETCFVTLDPLDKAQIEYIRNDNNTEAFAILKNSSEFSKYVHENTYGRFAYLIQQNFPPEKVSEIADLIKTDLPEGLSEEFGAFF